MKEVFNDIADQIKWGVENKDHPLIKELHEAINSNEDNIKVGLQIALGIVVEYLYKNK